MKRSLYPFILFVCVSALLGCASERKAPSMTPSIAMNTNIQTTAGLTKIISLQPFDQIVISGPVNITINGHQSQTQLRYTDNINSNVINTSVQNGVLNIQSNKPASIQLDMANTINKIVYHGNGQLITNNIGDNSMQIEVGGNALATINGNLVLSQIRAEDNAVLHAYWLNSSNLQVITSDRAKVFLAGIVNELNLIASGDSDVDAKYLRVNNAYIRTLQDADVGVSVKHAMSTWSTERSTIYYYRDPGFGTYYLDSAGAALRMVGLPKKE